MIILIFLILCSKCDYSAYISDKIDYEIEFNKKVRMSKICFFIGNAGKHRYKEYIGLERRRHPIPGKHCEELFYYHSDDFEHFNEMVYNLTRSKLQELTNINWYRLWWYDVGLYDKVSILNVEYGIGEESSGNVSCQICLVLFVIVLVTVSIVYKVTKV